MRRLAAIGVLLAACIAAVLLTGATSESATGKRYVIEFDNAFGLVEDGEVKIGGVTKSGKITGFKLTDTEPRKVAVSVVIEKPGFDALTTRARCGVRQQSLIGEYFIDCEPGRGRPLPDRGRVPVRNTFSTVPVDLINNVQRRPYRERFRLILTELGVGLAGRPEELNEVIRRAHPGLRETTETLEILARQREYIKSFVRDADTVSAAVEPRKNDLSRWAKEASETAVVQASRSQHIAEQWRKLPRFLAELRPTAAQLEQTADEQIPLLRRLRTAAPKLRTFLAELGPFAEDSRPSTRALGRAAVQGRLAIEESKEEVDQLRELSYDVPRLAKPLRQFLQTIDDRSRSIENDPLARETAPPPPDKTAYRNGQGFTGMEALLNYVYYQVLGINLFDEVSHILRITPLQNSCIPYSADPTPEQRDLCSSHLGPSQPGLFGQPDPTEGGGTQKVAVGGIDPKTGKKLGYRRGRGQPEAPPRPGQRDISKPQIKLPPHIRDLLDGLRGIDPNDPPPLPDVPDITQGQLLDYLLRP